MLSELLVPSLLILGAYLVFIRGNGQPEIKGPKANRDKENKSRLGFLDGLGLTREQYQDALDDRTTGRPNRYY